ncbi:MAG: lysophospholipid acyltransferase family protein [Gammaproteobacteria bacterium]|nr:lysophospholipid acyltransferase family protein [Gammaproteobacteria bacterium]
MTDPACLRLRYALAGAAAWLAYRVFGLRRSVVRENLQRSFPEWSDAERRAAERDFARRQGEVAAEVSYARRIGAAELRDRVTLANPAILASAAPPRPMVLVGAHHGNFEWMLQRLSLEFGSRIVGLYKPIRNPRVDAWLRKMRTRFGARLIPAKSVLQELARMRDIAAIGLVADQVPRTSPEKHWVTFLNQDTAFYMGPELLGRALRSQVVLVRMQRLARGRYEIVFEPLNQPGDKLPGGEVTARYARALERWIRDDPPGWWWSHRRWKLKPDVYGSASGR